MLNQLFKAGVYLAIYRWLQPRWRGLLVLGVVIVLTTVVHGEYLSYVALTDNQQYLLLSYVIKWAILVLALPVYVLLITFGGSVKNGNAASSSSADHNSVAAESTPRDDGFDFLRDKPSLHSRGDKLLDKD